MLHSQTHTHTLAYITTHITRAHASEKEMIVCRTLKEEDKVEAGTRKDISSPTRGTNPLSRFSGVGTKVFPAKVVERVEHASITFLPR